jgi:hypothetical protein
MITFGDLEKTGEEAVMSRFSALHGHSHGGTEENHYYRIGWDYVSELRSSTGLLFIPQVIVCMKNIGEMMSTEENLVIRPPEVSDNPTTRVIQ